MPISRIKVNEIAKNAQNIYFLNEVEQFSNEEQLRGNSLEGLHILIKIRYWNLQYDVLLYLQL